MREQTDAPPGRHAGSHSRNPRAGRKNWERGHESFISSYGERGHARCHAVRLRQRAGVSRRPGRRRRTAAVRPGHEGLVGRGLHLCLSAGADGCDARADGAAHAGQHLQPQAHVPGCQLRRRGQPQCRYAVFVGVAGPVARAGDPVRARHARALLHDAADGCVDQCVCLAGQAHHRDPPRQFRHHRTRLARHAAQGRAGNPLADVDGLADWPYPGQRQEGSPGRAPAPGPVPADAAVCVGRRPPRA
ncbi:hypothetical protein D9M70_361410 [compost metagenome]